MLQSLSLGFANSKTVVERPIANGAVQALRDARTVLSEGNALEVGTHATRHMFAIPHIVS